MCSYFSFVGKWPCAAQRAAGLCVAPFAAAAHLGDGLEVSSCRGRRASSHWQPLLPVFSARLHSSAPFAAVAELEHVLELSSCGGRRASLTNGFMWCAVLSLVSRHVLCSCVGWCASRSGH